MCAESSEDRLKGVVELKKYYQEFHHKCVGWYITVMGFFIAGTIAVSVSDAASKTSMGWIIIVSTVFISAVFYLCISHYSKRIERLGEYLELDADKIPHNWRKKHNKSKFKNIGSLFFYSIIALMQIAVIGLVMLKYDMNVWSIVGRVFCRAQ